MKSDLVPFLNKGATFINFKQFGKTLSTIYRLNKYAKTSARYSQFNKVWIRRIHIQALLLNEFIFSYTYSTLRVLIENNKSTLNAKLIWSLVICCSSEEVVKSKKNRRNTFIDADNQKLSQKVVWNGSVRDKTRFGRFSALTAEENVNIVHAMFEHSLKNSIKQGVRENELTKYTVHTVWEKLNFQPWKPN